jgi:Ig-like domain-containing protein
MRPKQIVTAILLMLLLSACGAGTPGTQAAAVDVAAVRTSAASTVISQFTLTAAVFTPVPSQPAEPTETSIPATAATVETSAAATTAAVPQVTNALGTTVALCDSLTYVADVNVPDDTNMSPGQDFIKTWKVKNTGSCPWGAGYKLVYAGYQDDMSGQFQPLSGVIQPGQEVEISVQLKAPDAANQYVSAWQMSNPAGVTFPQIIFVKIVVQ